jgi:hypothetical protein
MATPSSCHSPRESAPQRIGISDPASSATRLISAARAGSGGVADSAPSRHPYLAEPCAGDGALVRHLEAVGLLCVYSGEILAVIAATAKMAFDTSTMAARGSCAPYQQNLLLCEKRNYFNNFSTAHTALGRFRDRAGRPGSVFALCSKLTRQNVRLVRLVTRTDN